MTTFECTHCGKEEWYYKIFTTTDGFNLCNECKTDYYRASGNKLISYLKYLGLLDVENNFMKREKAYTDLLRNLIINFIYSDDNFEKLFSKKEVKSSVIKEFISNIKDMHEDLSVRLFLKSYSCLNLAEKSKLYNHITSYVKKVQPLKDYDLEVIPHNKFVTALFGGKRK